jgi:Co/Zn/Cd efflux system component
MTLNPGVFHRFRRYRPRGCGTSGCCAAPPRDAGGARFRRVLWGALAVNALMFVAEIGAGLAAGSVSLQADALDFLGDAANYGLSLFVLSMALAWRARAALVKGLSMGAFGLWVLGLTLWHALAGTVPAAEVMGGVGLVALAVNVVVALTLYCYRAGDANMRSVWLCSRNDALGNIAVVAAASGVFATARGWPDILVALVMAGLALSAAVQVVRQARLELRRDARTRTA